MLQIVVADFSSLSFFDEFDIGYSCDLLLIINEEAFIMRNSVISCTILLLLLYSIITSYQS